MAFILAGTIDGAHTQPLTNALFGLPGRGPAEAARPPEPQAPDAAWALEPAPTERGPSEYGGHLAAIFAAGRRCRLSMQLC